MIPLIIVEEDTLVVDLGQRHQFLSCAIYRGGFSKGRYWINQQVYPKDKGRDDAALCLKKRAKDLGLKGGVVGMMTGASVSLNRSATRKKGGLQATAIATAGLMNGCFVGDSGAFNELKWIKKAQQAPSPKPHTINVMACINHPMDQRAMVEAIGLMAQARTVEVLAFSNQNFSGSGTDSLALACPLEGPSLRWAGMHTVLGEVLGKATREAVRQALLAWPGL